MVNTTTGLGNFRAKDPLGLYTAKGFGLGAERPSESRGPSVTAALPRENGEIPDSYYASIRSAESGGDDAADNPRSTALGRYQFLDSTWNDLAAKYPELGLTDRRDPEQQERAIRAFTGDNASVLRSNGVSIEGGTLYAAHFLGADGALNAYKAPPETPMSSIVSPAVVKANPFLKSMTAGSFQQWAARHGGGATGAGRSGPAPEVGDYSSNDPFGLYAGRGAAPAAAESEPGAQVDPAPEEAAQVDNAVAENLFQQLEQQEPGRYRLMDADEATKWQTEWQKANVSTDLLGDTSRLLGMGQVGVEQSVREAIGMIPGVGPSLVAAGDAIDNWLYGKPSDVRYQQLYEKDAATLTPETRAARDKAWWDEDKGQLGPAWIDPRSYFAGVVESLPGTLLTMAPAMVLAKGAYAAALLRTGSEKLAAAAAARTALLSGAISEGTLGGADTSRAVRQEIAAIPREQLLAADSVKALIAQGYSEDAAIAALTDDAAAQAFVIGGVATGAFGGMGDRVLAKIFAEKIGGTIGRRVLSGVIRGTVAEGLLEEAPQEAGAQIAQNIALQGADPGRDLAQGVANAALGGAAVGGPMGAGFGGVAGAVSPKKGPIERALDYGAANQPLPETVPIGGGVETRPATPAPGAGPLEEARPSDLDLGPAQAVAGQVKTEPAPASMRRVPLGDIAEPKPGSSVIVNAPGMERFTGRIDGYEDVTAEDGTTGREAMVVTSDGEVLQIPSQYLEVADLSDEMLRDLERAETPPIERSPVETDASKSRVIQGRTMVLPDERHARLYDFGQQRKTNKGLARTLGDDALLTNELDPVTRRALADEFAIPEGRVNEIADDYRYRVERAARAAESDLPHNMHSLNPELLKRYQAERQRDDEKAKRQTAEARVTELEAEAHQAATSDKSKQSETVADSIVANANLPTDLPQGPALPEQTEGALDVPADLFKSDRNDSSVAERASQGAVLDAEFPADGGRRGPFEGKSYGALDVPTQSRVLKAVLALVHDDKVFRAIAESIPVAVMNELIGSESSAEDALHDRAVFVHALSTNRDLAVRARAMDALVSSPAFTIAKAGLEDLARASLDFGSAAQADQIDGHSAATSPLNDTPLPTEAQQRAGNYKLGHLRLGGLEISIENPPGSLRSGVDHNGRPWSVQMKHAYGYIRGSRSKDGDHVDVFVRKGVQELADDATVFVVDQVDPSSRRFDEQKVMLGFASITQARRAYMVHYEKGWRGLGDITAISLDGLKRWLDGPNTKQAFAKTASQYSDPIPAASRAATPISTENIPETIPPVANPPAISDSSGTAPDLPKLSPIEKRASTVFMRVLREAEATPTEMSAKPLWQEQMAEQVVTPNRYHRVEEEENAKGIRIGDEVEVFGARSYAATISTQGKTQGVLLVNTRGFPVFRPIKDVSKVDAAPAPPAAAAAEDDIVEQRVTPSGPWDFNDTYPAPDREKLDGLDQEGRFHWEERDESGMPSAEQVAGTFEETLQELQILNLDIAAARQEIDDIRRGVAKLGKKDPDKEIKRLEASVREDEQAIEDIGAVHLDLFSQEAVDALLAEGARRAAVELRQTDPNVERPRIPKEEREATVPETPKPESPKARKPEPVVDNKKVGGAPQAAEPIDATSVDIGRDSTASARAAEQLAAAGYDLRQISARGDDVDAVMRDAPPEAAARALDVQEVMSLKSQIADLRGSKLVPNTYASGLRLLPTEPADAQVVAIGFGNLSIAERAAQLNELSEQLNGFEEAVSAGVPTAASLDRIRSGRESAASRETPADAPERQYSVGPVITLTGNELGVDFMARADMPALRKAAIRWYRENLQGRTTRTRDGREVRFVARGRGKSTAGKGDLVLRMIPAIEAIIRAGEQVATAPGQRQGVKRIIWLAAPVSLEGRVHRMVVALREQDDGTFHYDLTPDNRAGSPGFGPGGPAAELSRRPAVEGAPDSDEMPRVTRGGLAPDDGPLPSLDAVFSGLNLVEWTGDNKVPAGWDVVEASAPFQLSAEQRAELDEIVKQASGLSEVHWRRQIVLPNGAPGWGTTTPTTAAGFYSPSSDAIVLAADTASPRAAYHEAFHRLQHLFLTPAEQALLKQEVGRLRRIVASLEFRRDQVGAMSQSELEAEAFAIYASRGDALPVKPYKTIRAAWDRIAALVRRVRNWLSGHGFQIAEDVFTKARGGEIAVRPRRDGNVTGAPEFSIADNRLTDEVKGKLLDLQPTLLGATPLNYFQELARPNMTAVKEYIRVKRAMDTYRGNKHAEADELAQEWLKFMRLGYGLLPSATGKAKAAQLADIMHDATLTGVDPSKSDEETRARPGYDALRKRFVALPQSGRELFVKVRDAYERQSVELDKLILDNIRKAQEIAQVKAQENYERRLDQFKAEGLTGEELRRAEERAASEFAMNKLKRSWANKARQSMMRRAFERTKAQKPYFPLARFGRYFVAVRELDGTVVSFSRMEKAVDQRRLAKDLREAYPAAKIETGVIDKAGAGLRDAMDPRIITEITGLLKNAGVDDSVLDAVWQRYLQSMPDLSTRKRFLHRKGTAGFAGDALRTFSSHFFHASHQMARLRHGIELQEVLDQVAQQARAADDPTRGMTLANELALRHKWVMQPTGEALAQKINSAMFVWYLGLTPAAAIVNLTQTPLLGIPILGARFGAAKAAAALLRASGDFVAGKGSVQRAKLTTEEQWAMERFYESGLIDRSQAHDLAGVGNTGVNYSPLRARVMAIISWGFHHAEVANRESTALAAFRLARAAGETPFAAVDTAHDLTWRTHFDYSNSNRARYLQSDPAKAAFIFMNFSLNMYYRLFRDMHQSFAGETPQARKEARYQLAGIMGMMTLMGGVTGFFGFKMLMFIAGTALSLLGGDDDDPMDLVTEMRRNVIGLFGPDIGGMILDGVPGHLLGIDLTSRIGMADFFVRAPDPGIEGREWFVEMAVGLLGASAATGANVADGLSLIMQGKTVRGAELIAPKFLKDVMQAYRFANEGLTTRNQDEILPADQLDAKDILVKMIGFTPAKIAETYERNAALKDAEQGILDRRRLLLNQFALAVSRDDREAQDAVLKRIEAFNAVPIHRPVAITRDTIRQSLRTRARNAAKREDGVLISNEALGQLLRQRLPDRVY